MKCYPQTLLIMALELSCGGKDDTSATEGSDTDAATTTTTTTAATTDPSTGETATPTTSGTSTGGDTSSGGADSSTGEQPACESAGEDCGVIVSETGSFCADPPPAKDELVLEVLGPGKIKITEKGRTSACNITIDSDVFLGPNKSLIVNYVVNGQPDRSCQCRA